MKIVSAQKFPPNLLIVFTDDLKTYCRKDSSHWVSLEGRFFGLLMKEVSVSEEDRKELEFQYQVLLKEMSNTSFGS